jgi:hypothetical protein
MSKKLTVEQIVFISESAFDFARVLMNEPDLTNETLNTQIVNVSLYTDEVSTMFLEDGRYLMTIDRELLSTLN